MKYTARITIMDQAGDEFLETLDVEENFDKVEEAMKYIADFYKDYIVGKAEIITNDFDDFKEV